MAKIILLTVSHGAAHRRVAAAVEKALRELDPTVDARTEDILVHSTGWFRAYYNSYELPLRYWPALWGWIEGKQHAGSSTGPGWLYRRGARPLFRLLEAVRPDAVVATETGALEIATLARRQGARWLLVGINGLDVDRAWAQPEVDLYPVTPDPVAGDLAAWGVPASKIVPCGMPLDPAFLHRPGRAEARRNLGLARDAAVVLVLFGGAGFGRPRVIVRELAAVTRPFEAVFITGRNEHLRREAEAAVLGLAANSLSNARVFGWVDNMHEWLAAADLVVNKPSGLALLEAVTCGVPFLAIDPLPGNERRHCDLIERWGVGFWIRQSGDLARVIERLLRDRGELGRISERAGTLARPRAAYDAAEAILKLIRDRSGKAPAIA
jgi:processive 1,2-diacylglycerol beta-glucosyltransferase